MTRRRPAMAIVAVVAGLAIAVYVILALVRLRYPYELEWIEGGMVQHVERLRTNQPLYAPPNLTFIPDIYTPLYYVVCAALAKVIGNGFFTLRLVSVIASFALFGALYKLTVRETDDRLAGVIGAGLFAACYRLSGAWLDIGRVDTLCMALLFWGMYVARDAKTAWRGVAAGGLLTLAFLSKQVALLPALAVFPYLLLLRRWKVALVYGAAFAVGLLGSTVALDANTHGWYSTYVFTIPAHHEIASQYWSKFWTGDLLYPLLAALVFVGAAYWALWRGRRDGFWFHSVVGLAILVAAYSARLHTGGYDNVLLPLYAELGVLFGIGVHHVLQRSERRSIVVVATVVCVAQFAWLAYNPFDQVSSARNEATGKEMLDGLRAIDGLVYLPGHPWYLHEVGKPTHAQAAAIEDVLRAHVNGSDVKLRAELFQAIADRKFAAIVVESAEGLSYLPDNVCRYYAPSHPITADGSVLDPITGTVTGPDMVWLPLAVPGDKDCGTAGGKTIG